MAPKHGLKVHLLPFQFLVLMFLSTFAYCSHAASLPPLSVPLTIQEVLPAGVPGIARASTPVTVGIPLPENSGISSVLQLGLSGVSGAQFRPLAWWPNGNIRWVLTDFQTDLLAGGSRSDVVLTTGNGNFGGSNLATDGASITVDTGDSRFIIRKANFNIFDSVTVKGQTLVASGNAGRISAVGADGIVYTSANDPNSTAIIEDNGPMRCAIKITGTLRSAAGGRLLDYTLRMHFFKGRAQVKAALSLRNANKANNYSIAFRSAEAIVPLTLASTKYVTLSLKTSDVTRPLVGTAVLQQGHNNAYSFPFETDFYNWDPPVPGSISGTVFIYDSSFEGFRAGVNGETLNNFGVKSDWSAGYARLFDDTGNGLSAAFKDMRGYWPESFEIKDSGDFSMELYGKWTNKQNKILWGKHSTREWLWEFSTSTSDPKKTLYDIQYPVLARAPLSYYEQTKAIFGQNELATPQEEAAAISSIGKASPSLNNFVVDRFWRVWGWAMTGGDNQIDFALDDLYDYLRTGAGAFWLRGEQRTLFNYDAAITHSDGYTTEYIAENKTVDPMPGSKGINGVFIDMEHAHVMSMPFYYFLTGNELAKDDYTDYCELMYRSQMPGPSGWYPVPQTIYLRAWSRKIRNLALAHEFFSMTQNGSLDFRPSIAQAIDWLLDSRDTNDPLSGTNGRNMNRGYFYLESVQIHKFHTFFYAQIQFDAIWHVYRVMRDTDWSYARSKEIEDYLTGLSHFIFDEVIDHDTSWNRQYQFWSDYNLNSNANTDQLAMSAGNAQHPYNVGRPARWLYAATGDQKYLTMGIWSTWGANDYATSRTSSELQEQSLLHSYIKIKEVPVWKNLNLTSKENGDGTYTLSWIVPLGATDFRIKYSDKNIVEWLGFDKNMRTYLYDPATNVAFFAAKNLDNNPAPAVEGSVQTITVSGLPASLKFSAKCLLSPRVAPPANLRGVRIQ